MVFVSRDMPKSSKSSKKGSSKKSSGGSRSVTATIPKSLSSTIDKIHARLSAVDTQLRDFTKEFRTTAKGWSKQMAERSSGRGTRAKRKPSEYNLFLKDKMKQGMTMTEAVQSWKARGGASSMSSSESSSSMSSSRMSSSSMDEDEGETSTDEEA
ncbi:MAG TPA: hypothetical protein VE177_08010 [Candidatus Binatus sp.]|nr:hypothetical protein [Candidatus Binatus sp.]